MDQLERLKNFFKTADEKTLEDFRLSLQLVPLTSEQEQACQKLLHTSARFVRDLHGENGSPRLLESDAETQMVMKTYALNVVGGEVVEHADRLDLLREEVAAFFVSVYFPLIHVPPTVLRPVSQDQMKTWNIPQIYDSNAPDASVANATMFQQFVEGAKTYVSLHKPLLEVASPRNVLGLLIFDYLLAYGD